MGNWLVEELTKGNGCGHKYSIQRYCGVQVCLDCSDHKGLARCYCGWAADGGNGKQQLREMGEWTIEDEYGD